jgi:N-formylglutamate deformylase
MFFECIKPENPIPILVTIPHSGTFIPYHSAQYFTAEHYSSLINTDFFIDRLYGFLTDMGITIIKNNVYRYVIDVNRIITEPALGDFFKSLIPSNIPDGSPHNWEIYKEIPNKKEIESRIEKYYTPFHNEIRSNLEELKMRYKKVLLLDLHSFVGGIDDDITIGNKNGTTCSENILDVFCDSFLDSDFSVSKNNRYIGGYIIKNYYEKSKVETCSIEVKAGAFINPEELDRGKPPFLSTDYMKQLEKSLFLAIERLVGLAQKDML